VHPSYPDLPRSVSQSIDQLTDRILAAMSPGDRADVSAIERELTASLSAVGRSVMQRVLEGLDPGGDDVRHERKRYWQAIRSEREYMTPFGPVVVERGVYRAVRNGPTICPVELRAGIVEGFWTPHAARLAALSVSDMTPYRAETFFRELRMMAPSRSSLDRLPKALNERWEADRQAYEERLLEAAEIPAEAVAVGVSLDGVMVPMRGTNAAAMKAETRSRGQAAKGPAGYREVACGSLSFYDADGERLATWRMARMPEAKQKTLKQQLRRELDHVRAQRPDLKVVLVADGAANNWDYLVTLEAAHQVVDFYHAAEHLKRALDLAMGASSVATQAMFRKLRLILRDAPDGVDKVIKALKKLNPPKRGDHRDYRRGVNYFTRHRDRMRYAALQAANLPIGSGVIEGTCKSLASDRLKRAGMRWDERGGQAILNLRAWTQSDRFDAAWGLLAANYNADVPRILAAA
jgi:hypothetical protein